MPNDSTAAVPEKASAIDPAPVPRQPSGSRGAMLVAAGILLSRILGLVRERVFAHYLGNSVAAAAFRAGQRIPNYLQNLFGEGVLSASFIPVYAGLLGKNEREAADKVAGAVFGLLSLVTTALTAVGVLAAPLFVDLLTPGLDGETRSLAIATVRIAFPGTGLLVLSAWCLGVLNSHRRFFLSYAAPVAWNGVLIAALVIFGPSQTPGQLAITVTWAGVIGSLLQFAVQLPTVMGLLTHFRPTVRHLDTHVRQVLRSFGPIVVGRGVVQISAFVDGAVASLISDRAYSALSYAQILYLLPISLFGMAVSASELPEMSRAAGANVDVAAKLRERLGRGARRIAFFVVPSVVALGVLGDVVGGALLQTGKFGPAETRYLWYLLMGSTVGLLAATLGRLYASAFYAQKDTQTPLRYAIVRVALGGFLAFVLAVRLPPLLGIPPHLGAVFISAASGLAAWVEFWLLRRKLGKTIGVTGVPTPLMGRLWVAAAIAGGAGLAIKWALTRTLGAQPEIAAEWGGWLLPAPLLHPIWTALIVLVPFGLLYFGLTALLKVPESQAVVRRVLRR